MEGQIMSPLDYEDKTYPHNLECEYLVKQKTGNRIRLDVLAFHLEDSDSCKFDYLEIYAGKTTEAPLIGRFCGNSIPSNFISEDSTLLLKFKSDWSTAHSGFTIKYRAICGGKFEESTGVLMSPMYPQQYTSAQMCIYEIGAPLGSAVTLQFQDFDMEGSSDCSYDFLEIYDGHQSNDTKIGRYCGTGRPNQVVSTYNFLTLVFQSDGSVGGRGFKANYSLTAVGCGGIVKSDTTISSPTNGENYDHNLLCRWLIIAPEGFNIQLNWQTFRLENSETCQYDYVEVYDNTTRSPDALGRYCKSIPPLMTTSGNMASIVFKTDDSNANVGFTVNVSFLDSRRGK